ncbi:HPr family phosphocarrier protein [Engelhardtia mirabilis]|uniref:HPr family phosphocarrier protein n=1 Tax=Engelhardtia mirabilis TaxID=2528011 RepID=UPI003AF3F5FB
MFGSKRDVTSQKLEVEVCNSQGLHARPCHAVVSTALGFRSELRVAYDGRTVNGKSILELMTLNAAYGARLELFASGEDAESLLSAVSGLFSAGFGELD